MYDGAMYNVFLFVIFYIHNVYGGGSFVVLISEQSSCIILCVLIDKILKERAEIYIQHMFNSNWDLYKKYI